MANTKAQEAAAFKYNLSNLVNDLGITAASVRQGLRSLKIAKNGGVYGWNTKTDYEAVRDQMKERGSRKPAMGKKTDAKKADAKPSRKSKEAAPAKPARKGKKDD